MAKYGIINLDNLKKLLEQDYPKDAKLSLNEVVFVLLKVCSQYPGAEELWDASREIHEDAAMGEHWLKHDDMEQFITDYKKKQGNGK